MARINSPEVVVWPNTRPPESHPDVSISVMQDANGWLLLRMNRLHSEHPGMATGPTLATVALRPETTLRLIAELADTLDTSLAADAALKDVVTTK